jgi:hypothetical protein
MARTDLTKTTAPGSYADAGVAVTMTAADVANKNQFTAGGKDLIIAHNTGASAHNVTVTSAPDPYGRSGDIDSESIAAGELRIYGPLAVLGWIQSDGKVYLEADNAEVEFGVIKVPG